MVLETGLRMVGIRGLDFADLEPVVIFGQVLDCSLASAGRRVGADEHCAGAQCACFMLVAVGYFVHCSDFRRVSLAGFFVGGHVSSSS